MSLTFRVLSVVLAVLAFGCIGVGGADDLTPLIQDPINDDQPENSSIVNPDSQSGPLYDQCEDVLPATPGKSSMSPDIIVETEAAMFFNSEDPIAEVPLTDAEITGSGALTALSKETMIENALLYYINLERANFNLPPYVYNQPLASVAKTHTLLMISANYGGHTVPGEPSLGSRLTAAGIPWFSYGECINFGYPDLDAYSIAQMMVYDLVWDDAASSWGHRRIILDGLTSDPGYPAPDVYGYNLAGTGAAYGSLKFLGGTTYTGWHATMDFVGVTLPTPDSSKIGIFRNGIWYLDNNGDGHFGSGDICSTYGSTGWTRVTGDWNGDGDTEMGVYQNGAWLLDYDGSWGWSAGDKNYAFGATGWVPVVGDWDGDGKTEIGVYQNGAWLLDYDGSGGWSAGDQNIGFGASGWTPIAGDWNGDGKTEIGVYQNGAWLLDYDGSGGWSAGDKNIGFGAVGWIPVKGDWNGDGRVKVGVYKDGTWLLDYNGSGGWSTGDKNSAFGAAGWVPIVGDWNANGKAKIGVFNSGSWLLDYDGSWGWSTSDKSYAFGDATWTPAEGEWN